MSDVDLKTTPKGSKKAAVPQTDYVLPLQPAGSPPGAVALAIELEQVREQLADAQLMIAAKELEIKTLRGDMAKIEDLILISDRNYQGAINETAEIRGVLKSLAAVLIKWDGWVAKETKQDPGPEVQS
jgi:hypothetical protein